MIPDSARPLILESLRVGCDLASACRGAKVPLPEARALLASDPAWCAAVNEALAEGERASREAWAGVAKESVAATAREAKETPTPTATVTGGTRPTLLHSDDAERWAHIKADCARIAPGLLGSLLWINERCKRAGMQALDDWWIGNFGGFYASDKPEHAGRVGLRGAKSTSIPRALTNDATFTEREIDPTIPGVIPIISVDKTEADGRFATIRGTLRAMGMAPKKPDDSDVPILPDGISGIYESSTLASGGGVIYLTDSQGHGIEFRIYAAKVAGVVGYTGVAGFCDEVDLWIDERGANPAQRVLDLLSLRYTTQPRAHLYTFSASYYPDSAHKRKIDEGDTMQQHLARLGELGAQRDNEARARLAALIKSNDPRLLAKADPMSPDIPSWVTNPLVSIETCYGKSKERIGPMLALYGGRASEATGRGGSKAWTIEDWTAHREAMRGIGPQRASETDFARLHFDPFGGGEVAAPARYRGL